MTRRPALLTLLLAVVALFAAALAFGQQISDSIQQVLVTNFPDPFPVRGRVGIDGPVRLGRTVMLEPTLVSPVPRESTTDLIDGGVLDVHGFTSITLSLAAEVKGDLGRPGAVGAILVPETELVERAFREEGRVLFPLEVRAELEPKMRYAASNQPIYTLGFPRYHVYYYNSSRKSVSVELFGMLAAR